MNGRTFFSRPAVQCGFGMWPLLLVAALGMAGPGPAQAFTQEEPLTMVFEPPASPPGRSATAAIPASCVIVLGRVDDQRRNKASMGANLWPDAGATVLGPLHAVSLSSSDGAAWLRSGLASMRRFGVQTDGNAASTGPARGPVLEVSLKMAHAWSSGLNLNSHVLIFVSQPSRAGDAPRHVHGFGNKLNWAGTNSEYMTVLNNALDNAMQNLAKELVGKCTP